MSRTLVVADIHANAPALEAVLAAEPERDSVVFLGDAVDVGPHPNAVCERLLELDLLAGVRGNHDRTVLDAADPNDSSESNDPNAPSDDPHAQWQEWTNARLAPESRTFLESLDRTTTVSPGVRTLRLHHGDFPRPVGHDGRWPTRATPEEETALFETVAARYDEDVIVHGHSHYPFEATVAGTTFVNPGSVGLQRDGWPLNRARYAVWEDGAIDLRSVPYETRTVTTDSKTLDSPYRDHWNHAGASANAE